MKLYIATLIKHDEYFITAQTFTATTADGVACQVADLLDREDIPYEYSDILSECSRSNQSEASGPLSIGIDTDLCHEYLLTTKVVED